MITMVNSNRFFSLLLTLVLCITLVAIPTKAEGIQTQDFNTYHLSTWIPSNWESIQRGTELILVPKVSDGVKEDMNSAKNKNIAISVTNYSAIEIEGEGVTLIQKSLYDKANNVEQWHNDLEAYYKELGLKIQRIQDENIGTVFMEQSEDLTRLIVFFVKDGQALSASLIATDNLADFNVLKEQGLYEIFQNVVKGLRPSPKSDSLEKIKVFMETISTSTTSDSSGDNSIMATKSLTTYRGPSHCHGTVCGQDHRVIQTVDFTGSLGNFTNTRVYNNYWFRHSIAAGAPQKTLFKTGLNTANSCESGSLAYKRIDKKTSLTTQDVSDTWYPNRAVTSSTYVTTHVGETATDYCVTWQPFY